jgi:hypothetical protein
MAEPGTRMSGYPLDRRDPRRRQSAQSGPVGDLEGLAGRILARYTGESVVIQDDGSKDRMPDIRIDYMDRPSAFVEVVSHIDRAYAAIARRVVDPKSTWTSRDLTYAWVLTVSKECHLDALAPRIGSRPRKWCVSRPPRDLGCGLYAVMAGMVTSCSVSAGDSMRVSRLLARMSRPM